MSKPNLYVMSAGAVGLGLVASYMRKRSGKSAPRPPQRFVPLLAENRPQSYRIWRGPSMLVLDVDGNAGQRDETGMFFRQARYLRGLRLELFGERSEERRVGK